MKEPFDEIVKAVKKIKSNPKYSDCVCLVRVYENTMDYMSIGNDAKKVAKIAGQTLSEERKSFAFPHTLLDVYLPKLIKQGERVVIIDKL